MADRYWRGGAGTWNTTSTTNWSDTSGGTGGFSVPTASDNVIFDQAATYSVVMTGALACLSITVSAGTVSFTTGTTPTLQVNGSMSLIAMTWTSTGAITFNATTSGQTITTGGTTINAPITFNGVGGEWSLGSALTTGATQTTTLTNGSLILNGYDLTTGIFSSTNTNTRSIAFGANNIILAHTTAAQTVLSMAIATGFTYTSSGTFGSGTGTFQATMSTTRTFVFGTTGGSITNAPILYLVSGASVATITTGSWFNELNLGTCSFTIAATSLNVNQLYTASSTCVLTNMTVTMRGTGYMQTNNSIGPLIINTSGTVYMPTGGSTVTCTTCTLTAGSLNMYTNGTITCSSTFTFSGGSIDYLGAINCTTFTVAGANFAMVAGSLTPSVSFVITSGTFTYSGGTLAAVPTFTHTAGTVNFNKDYALTTNGTYTFTAGALNLITNITLSTGIFSSANINTRSIAFGTPSVASYINLTHTTAATTVLSMATLTGFSFTGVGGFTVADMANTRTFSVGNTAGGSATTAPSLTFTTGASVATLTTGSWFKDLSFFDTTFTLGTTALNIAGNLQLGNGLYTTLSITMRGSGWLQNRYNTITQAMAALTINTTGTVSIYPGGYNWWCTTLTITAGTLDFTGSGGTITCSSTVTYTAGTLTLTDGAMYCTTFTVNGAAFTFNAGGLYPSVSFVLTSGSLTLGGTAILNDGVLPLFTHTAGTVTLNKSWAIGSAGTSGTYTFTAGTLTISEGYYLQCAIFSSSGAGVRTINFGTTRYTPSYYNWPSVGTNGVPPSYIYLYNTTAAQTVLNMAIATNFTWTGSGLFNFPGANTGTMVFGTTGGSTTNAPNLYAGGANTLTVTTGSWFNVFNLLNAAYTTPATSVNVVEAFLLYSNGTHTGVTIVPKLTTTSIINNGYTFGGLNVNVADANIQLTSELVLAGALTLTQGTINTNTSNVTSASFASTGPYSRSIIGTNTTYTISGAGTTAWNFGSTGSALFNGSTQNFSVATNAAFDFASSSFTIEAWVYLNATGTAQCIQSTYPAAFAGTTGYEFLTTASNFLQFDTFLTGVNQTITATDQALTSGVWTHVAVVNNAGTYNLYVNGSQCTYTSNITQAVNSGGAAVTFGRSLYTSFQHPLDGYMTNIRVVKGVAVYTGNFTVPTKPLLPTQSADTNISAITGSQTSLLLSTPINSFLTDYSNNNFTVTNTGTATANILSPFTVMSPGITFTGFTISMTSASAKTFVGSGGTYPIINQGGAGALTITGNNTFYNITNTTQPTTISFTAATTTTFKYFSLDGIAGNLVTVTSATAANHTLSMSSGIANTQYMSISRSQATGGAGWIAATSTNGGTNSGWVFAVPRFVEMGDISFDTTDGGITFT